MNLYTRLSYVCIAAAALASCAQDRDPDAYIKSKRNAQIAEALKVAGNYHGTAYSLETGKALTTASMAVDVDTQEFTSADNGSVSQRAYISSTVTFTGAFPFSAKFQDLSLVSQENEQKSIKGSSRIDGSGPTGPGATKAEISLSGDFSGDIFNGKTYELGSPEFGVRLEMVKNAPAQSLLGAEKPDVRRIVNKIYDGAFINGDQSKQATLTVTPLLMRANEILLSTRTVNVLVEFDKQVVTFPEVVIDLRQGNFRSFTLFERSYPFEVSCERISDSVGLETLRCNLISGLRGSLGYGEFKQRP